MLGVRHRRNQLNVRRRIKHRGVKLRFRDKKVNNTIVLVENEE